MKKLLLVSGILMAFNAFSHNCEVKTFAKADGVLLSDKIVTKWIVDDLTSCTDIGRERIGKSYEVEIPNPFGAPSEIVKYKINKVKFEFNDHGSLISGEIKE